MNPAAHTQPPRAHPAETHSGTPANTPLPATLLLTTLMIITLARRPQRHPMPHSPQQR